MKVILQENVDHLGYLGDLVEVADGYARNYLLPRGKATEANSRNVKALEHLKRLTALKVKKERHGLDDLAKRISKGSLLFEVQTGKDDKLFGSVTAKDLEEGLVAQGIQIDRRKIDLPHPIKELGTFTIPVKLHRDITTQFSVEVVKKGGESPEDSAEPAEKQTSPKKKE